ncbi:AarF/UbiB family protein [Yoonia maritima]|uniref:class III lanthionine synthetase LanKC N-terminal domain-containing protein n=1 Tax=Yoonia maritima TaxID=1435347 RepID=UPI00373676AF
MDWSRLVEGRLGAATKDSIWRSSLGGTGTLPRQGWKLHVSATILSAERVFQIAADILDARGVHYKACATIEIVQKLNSGLIYGYAQIGKVMTVYPKTDGEAVELAHLLDRGCDGLPHPIVPFDARLRPGSNIYYRYGIFLGSSPTGEGEEAQMIERPDGELVADVRAPGHAVPDWLANPFERSETRSERLRPRTPISTTYKAYDVLSQRGKGGTYLGLDLSLTTARRCVIKEGRAEGEVEWSGRDGRWRIQQERLRNEALRRASVAVPEVYTHFETDTSRFLVMEYVDGETLQSVIQSDPPSEFETELKLCRLIAGTVRDIHGAGLVWRDCKPANFIIGPEGQVRPLDFEGAIPEGAPARDVWGSPGYTAPEAMRSAEGARITFAEDYYSLGATLHHLLTRKPPHESKLEDLTMLRPDVPPWLGALIGTLLSPDPAVRPSAEAVERSCAKGGLT